MKNSFQRGFTLAYFIPLLLIKSLIFFYLSAKIFKLLTLRGALGAFYGSRIKSLKKKNEYNDRELCLWLATQNTSQKIVLYLYHIWSGRLFPFIAVSGWSVGWCQQGQSGEQSAASVALF